MKSGMPFGVMFFPGLATVASNIGPARSSGAGPDCVSHLWRDGAIVKIGRVDFPDHSGPS